jgi:hypothetical protein
MMEEGRGDSSVEGKGPVGTKNNKKSNKRKKELECRRMVDSSDARTRQKRLKRHDIKNARRS